MALKCDSGLVLSLLGRFARRDQGSHSIDCLVPCIMGGDDELESGTILSLPLKSGVEGIHLLPPLELLLLLLSLPGCLER